MGNPPYGGARKQTKQQKADLSVIFDKIKKYKNLDYIACWFLKASQYIYNNQSQAAFVSTNSIIQGEQVSLLWPHIFSLQLEIGFAYQSFKWTNNARGNAGVMVVVVCIRTISSKPKFLFNGSIERSVKNITPYLAAGKNTVVYQRRNKNLSLLPKMNFGNMPNDGGHLLFGQEEFSELISIYPESRDFVRRFIGTTEFINGSKRFCLWISDTDLQIVRHISPIHERIEKVRGHRLSSPDSGTNRLAERPHQFRDLNVPKNSTLVIPGVCAERREYIPVGFVGTDTVVSNLANAIYDPPAHIFAIISSRIHVIWVFAVGGRMKVDPRYSSAICYNTFPFPNINAAKKEILEEHVFAVLEEREAHPEKTLAQLYDPDKMPDGLRAAHHAMDLAVEQCYRSKPFGSDEERLEYLFKLYEEMIEKEKAGEKK